MWRVKQEGGCGCVSAGGERDWGGYGWYSKQNNKFPTAYLSSVAEAPNGEIWVEMRSDGVVRLRSFDRDSVTYDKITKNADAFQNKEWVHLSNLCFANDGSLWFGTSHGLVRCQNPSSTRKEWNVTMYETRKRTIGGN